VSQISIKPRRVPWFPNEIEYRSGLTLDVYGNPLSYDFAMLPAKVVDGNVEMIEKGGTRTVRAGITVQTTPQSFFEIDDHIFWNGKEYTIIGIDIRRDYRGIAQFVKLTAVDKR
jgi:hypothetical protein